MDLSIVVIFDKIRKEKLTRLLASLQQQASQLNAEVLLVHESNQPLPKLELPFDFRYITIPEKRGIPFNRNQGIDHARGDVIVFIDDDCWVHDTWLSSLVRPLQEDKNLLAVTSGTKIPKANLLGDCISALGFPGGGSLGFEKVWKISKEGFTTHLAVGNCVLRREVFERIGYFDESMKSGAEDEELSFRMEKAGIPIRYVPQAHAFHEARTTIPSFVRWQLRRGRANYQFKKKVGNVGGFIKLRIWSAGNIVKENLFSPKLPLILSLLGLSFALQQIGYYQERKKNRE